MRTARTLVIVALAAGLVALFLRSANLEQVLAEVRTAQPALLVVAVGLTLASYLVRTRRWQYLLAPLGGARFTVAFRTTVIGFAASAILPARAGEVLRPLLLARRERLPATAAFATIVVERILDLGAVLLLLATYLLLFDDGVSVQAPALYAAVRLGALVITPVALSLLLVMAVLAGDPARFHRLVLGAARVLPVRMAHAVARLAQTFAEGLAVVRRPGRLLASMGLSLVLWIVIASQTWVVARAFGLAMSYTGAYLLTALLVVGIAIPTPGGVGGFHEAFRLGATAFFGADNDKAIGTAIVLHAVSFVPVVLAGLWFAFQDGLSIGRLRKLSEDAPEREAEARASALRTGSRPRGVEASGHPNAAAALGILPGSAGLL
ncbi:MAG: lysylphosphatidylglycerol synthase transmembrane domain-containing protein [Vicinamibacterales bacterium]